jgi:hypothetical protein
VLELEVGEDIPDLNSESMEDIVIRLGDAKMLAEKLAKISEIKYYLEVCDECSEKVVVRANGAIGVVFYGLCG